VVSVDEKSRLRSRQVRCTETSVSELLMTYRNDSDDVKTGIELGSRDKLGTYLCLAKRHPVLRQRDHVSGSCVERVNLSP
jgi:hypothetical protein